MSLPRYPFDRPRDLGQPLRQVKILVAHELDGERLDVMLTGVLHWRSRTSVCQLIEEGRVHLEGRSAQPSRRVRKGETVVIDVPPRPEPLADAEAPPLAVIYEDRWMVAIDKPPGIAVHPAGRRVEGTLIHALHRRYRRADDPAHDVVPRLLHRLDVETSGVLAIGLDDLFHFKVARQFERRKVQKVYLAVVHGRPEPAEGRIELSIGPDHASAVRLKQEARSDGTGLPAETAYRTLRQNGRFSLLELRPKTGRTHQLRVHLAAIGCPVVGDKIYGGNEDVFLEKMRGALSDATRARLVLDRHALHNHSLTFLHPVLQRELTLEAPLPKDLAELID
jgi:23S rRNA pseudouridine1911/1915/1917 synthase